MSEFLPKSGEIVIEIDHPKNSEVYFFPANVSLRSVWITPRSGARFQEPLSAFAATPVPGMRVHLDPRARTGRLVDALGLPQNADVLADVKRTGPMLRPPREFGDPLVPRVFQNLGEDGVATWSYWMRRLVDGMFINVMKPGQEPDRVVKPVAKVVQGKLPELIDILKTGKVLTPKYDHRAKGSKYMAVPAEMLEAAASTASGQ